MSADADINYRRLRTTNPKILPKLTTAPVVSVVLPCHNDQAHARQVLRAFALQTFRLPFEVLIGDDGGNDTLLDAVRSEDWPFEVRYLWQPHRGFRLAEMLNHLIRGALAPTIYISDMGDLPTPGLLDYLYSRLRDRTMLCGRIGDITEDIPTEVTLPWLQEILKTAAVERRQKQFVPEEVRTRENPEVFKSVSLCVLPNLMFAKTDWEEIGGFDEEYDEYGLQDYEFAYRWLQAGLSMQWLPDALTLNVGKAERRPTSEKTAKMFAEMTRFAEVLGWTKGARQ